ncbi:hypothetical protein [Beijerinckia indica]|uniref:Glycosyl transferase family 8 n=1 Tax=Beijerinckia indica subsp. indica (strain ATCC 9039 / DSM 1715 / NCIMB 8712) TaxID=395963 RepID=B2IFN3_BEII9|nr:hypothetical protein [Beijerinckia indica]ACB94244.1 hypothetical protein Bind_0592 [Beijerinckia indica subsp. indica ATCC 9039]
MLQAPTQKNYGIAVIANDKIIDWLLPFLESYLATNATLPLYIIPYDDNISLTRKAAEIYGVTVVDPDSVALDALAKRLYPLSPGHRRRLRKFLSLALPLDEVIYLDVDIVLFRDMREMFGRLEAGKAEFIVAAQTSENDFVYNKKRADYDFLREALTFNDGFFLTSNRLLSLQDFYDIIDRDEKIFHRVRERGGLYAQPVTNFVVHRKGLKVLSFWDWVEGASGESFYKAEGVTFDAEGPRDHCGNKIYFAHWSGMKDAHLMGQRAFDAAWRDFSQKAHARAKF